MSTQRKNEGHSEKEAPYKPRRGPREESHPPTPCSLILASRIVSKEVSRWRPPSPCEVTAAMATNTAHKTHHALVPAGRLEWRWPLGQGWVSCVNNSKVTTWEDSALKETVQTGNTHIAQLHEWKMKFYCITLPKYRGLLVTTAINLSSNCPKRLLFAFSLPDLLLVTVGKVIYTFHLLTSSVGPWLASITHWLPKQSV